MKSLHTDPIPNGARFVALYGDGSGAALFAVIGNILYDYHGTRLSIAPDYYLTDHGYHDWLPLPETFRLWFEQKAGGE